MAFLDREPNGLFSQAPDLGALSFATLTIGGRMDTFDDRSDTYKFSLSSASRVEFSLPGRNDTVNQRRFAPIGNDLLLFNSTQTNFFEIDAARGKLDTILMPGDYFAVVRNRISTALFDDPPKPEDFPLANYGALLKTTPVAKSEIRIRINRLDGGGQVFDPLNAFSGKAELYVQATVAGKTQRSPVFAENQNSVSPNFFLKFSVNPAQNVVPIKLDVFDADPFNDERLNSNNIRTLERGWNLKYIVNQNRLILEDGGQQIGKSEFKTKDRPFNRVALNQLERGNDALFRELVEFQEGRRGFKNKNVLTVFDVEHEYFLADPSALFAKSSTAKGDSKSNTIVGTGANGILDGGKGNDDLAGLGGNDALVGGDGNDILRGGKGSDTLWGGKGSDTYLGGQGRDYFVLDLLKGVDVIKDFQNGKDAIALTGGLVYDALELQQENQHLGVYFNRQKIALIENANLDQIDSSDFVQADFTRIQGIKTAFVA
jgi:hypothetical protein